MQNKESLEKEWNKNSGYLSRFEFLLATTYEKRGLTRSWNGYMTYAGLPVSKICMKEILEETEVTTKTGKTFKKFAGGTEFSVVYEGAEKASAYEGLGYGFAGDLNVSSKALKVILFGEVLAVFPVSGFINTRMEGAVTLRSCNLKASPYYVKNDEFYAKPSSEKIIDSWRFAFDFSKWNVNDLIELGQTLLTSSFANFPEWEQRFFAKDREKTGSPPPPQESFAKDVSTAQARSFLQELQKRTTTTAESPF